MIGIKLITFTCDFTEEDRGRARIARPGERESTRETEVEEDEGGEEG